MPLIDYDIIVLSGNNNELRLQLRLQRSLPAYTASVKSKGFGIAAAASRSYFWDLILPVSAVLSIQQTINVPAGTIISIGFSFAFPGVTDGRDTTVIVEVVFDGAERLFRETLTTFQNGNPGGWESALLTDYIVRLDSPILQIKVSIDSSTYTGDLEIGIDNVCVTAVQGSDFGKNPFFSTPLASTCLQDLLANGGFDTGSQFPWTISSISTTGIARVEASIDGISAPEEGADFLRVADHSLDTWTVQQQITLPSNTAINCGHPLNLPDNPVQSSIQIKINRVECGESIPLYDTTSLDLIGGFPRVD